MPGALSELPPARQTGISLAEGVRDVRCAVHRKAEGHQDVQLAVSSARVSRSRVRSCSCDDVNIADRVVDELCDNRRGRRTMPKISEELLSVRAPKALADALRELASASSQTKSAVARRLLIDGV